MYSFRWILHAVIDIFGFFLGDVMKIYFVFLKLIENLLAAQYSKTLVSS